MKEYIKKRKAELEKLTEGFITDELQDEIYARQDELNRISSQVESEIVDIEFRPNKEDIDEIVAHNAFIHLEYMDQWDIWMSVETEKEKYHIHIQPRNKRSNASLLTFAEKIN
ncbi:MAG: hypothetical protein IPJ03_22410 [Ignavibacteriales bacterium]|nr:hypothetical protein [Ignavibacteriales bacterium]MBK7381696.1 hypothetical protein [Ignavibacteriales bacterium]